MLARFLLSISYFLWVIVAFTAYPCLAEDSTGDEFLVKGMQSFSTGYSTSFLEQTGSNLYLDQEGTLHLAYVDNYELWYAYSSDQGETWQIEKVPTGYDGDVNRAALVVDKDGTVFIAFSVNANFNYANPTAVTYGKEFNWDLYCAHKSPGGDWQIDTVDTHSTSNYGPLVTSMLVDRDNRVHIFAIYHGWWSYGGTAWEYVYSGGSWTKVTVVSFSDTTVDNCLSKYAKPLEDPEGNLYLVSYRPRNSNHSDARYFYVKKEGDTWGDPQELDQVDRTLLPEPYPVSIDAAIDDTGHIYIVYTKPDEGQHKVFFVEDFSPPEEIYTCANDEYIYELRLHVNAQGEITVLLIGLDNSETKIIKRDIHNEWSSPEVLPIHAYQNGPDVHPAVVQTDVNLNGLTDFMFSYLGESLVAKRGASDPATLYFYAQRASSTEDTSQDTTNNQGIRVSGSGGCSVSPAGGPLDVAFLLAMGVPLIKALSRRKKKKT